jgi:hypothetical protein
MDREPHQERTQPRRCVTRQPPAQIATSQTLMTGLNMEKNTEAQAATPAKATKAAYNRTPNNGSNWVEIVPGPADFAAGYAVPGAPNHGDVFAAATVVKAFFDTAYQLVKDVGGGSRWNQSGRAQAAATLAHACATVYAEQLSERQRKPSQRNPKKTAP